MKDSAYSTSFLLPMKRGTRWCTFSGHTSSTRPVPVEPRPPAWAQQLSVSQVAQHAQVEQRNGCARPAQLGSQGRVLHAALRPQQIWGEQERQPVPVLPCDKLRVWAGPAPARR